MYGSCDTCNNYPVALQIIKGTFSNNEKHGTCQPCNDLNTKAAK